MLATRIRDDTTILIYMQTLYVIYVGGVIMEVAPKEQEEVGGDE